jgi:hypothetical protein
MAATTAELIALDTGVAKLLPSPRGRLASRGGLLELRASKWLWTVVTDAVLLIAMVWCLPLVVLAVGTPFALAIAWLLRLIQ